MLLPFVLVPQQNRFVLERFGKFRRILEPGLNFKIPILDMVAYKHSLKEQVINVDSQNAITKDNVKLRIDGVLYYKFNDPWKASYNVKVCNHYFMAFDHLLNFSLLFDFLRMY